MNTVIIRADASVQIGMGHIMRTLVLADALTREGFQCVYVCRNLAGNAEAVIRRRGYTVEWLPALEREETEAADADVVLSLILHHQSEWVIVDHYQIDDHCESIWQRAAPILVIDDLADRQHQCRYLVDMTPDRSDGDYKHLLPDTCTLLLGASWTLVNSRFQPYIRESMLRRQVSDRVRHLLISLGGSDPQNLTFTCLDYLAAAQLIDQLQITVVVGSAYPWVEELRHRCLRWPEQVSVLQDVDTMPELLLRADLVIGSSGSSSWERCVMSVPTLQLLSADNQQWIARSLAARGAVALVEARDGLDYETFRSTLTDLLSNNKRLQQMAESSHQVCDGRGATRLAQLITAKS